MTLRRELDEKDAVIAELERRLQRVTKRGQDGGDEKMQEMMEARYKAERDLNVSLDRIVDMQRTIEDLKRAASNSKDKETIASLNDKLEQAGNHATETFRIDNQGLCCLNQFHFKQVSCRNEKTTKFASSTPMSSEQRLSWPLCVLKYQSSRVPSLCK